MGTQRPCPPKGQSPQFSAHIRCGQMAGWIKMPLATEVGLSPGDFVLDGDPAPPPQKGGGASSLISDPSPLSLWPNGWMDQDATWYGGRPRPKRYCVTWGPSSPLERGHSPQFSAHVYCCQTAVCIRIPLGTEVSVSLGDIVLDGDPAPLP